MIKEVYHTRIEADSSWHYLPVPQKVARTFFNAIEKRARCSINGKKHFPCALLNHHQRGTYIMLSKKRLSETGLSLGDEVRVELVQDHTEYQADLPEVLREVLLSDAEGYAIFQSLTPGKQRSIIYMIHNIKSVNLQIEKSLTIVDNLKAGIRHNRELTKKH